MLEPCLALLDRRLEELEEMPDDFVWWLDEGERWRYAGGDDQGAMSKARSELSEVKADRTVELIKRNRLNAEPLVVFGWHKRFTHRVAGQLGAMVIDGDTSENKKTAIVAEFAKGNLPVVVVNIKSGGVAIDLASARNAVFGEVDWVHANMEQAEARIRGPRQLRKVAYWYVLCSDSVDEFVWRTMLKRGTDSRRLDEHLLTA
jgi:superfamily II DNA or RNA helicase